MKPIREHPQPVGVLERGIGVEIAGHSPLGEHEQPRAEGQRQIDVVRDCEAGRAAFGLGAQHVLAMFGATALVPVLTGFPVTTTVFFSGIGTILFNLITRNPMIVRDLDVLVEAAARADVAVAFSVPTLDEEVWRRTEPGTPTPRKRLEALRRLVEAGIKAGVGMAPILPGISDSPGQLEQVVRAAREAGATGIWANVLNLRPGTREHFLEALARDRPEQLHRYEHLYR